MSHPNDYYVEHDGETFTHCGNPECGIEYGIGCSPCCKDLHLPIHETNSQRFDPIVYHRSPDGRLRFPGRSDAAVPKGFERVEIRTIHEARAFEREVNRREQSEQARNNERKTAVIEAAEKERHRDLRRLTETMSPFGRDFAKVAMERSSKDRPRTVDVGFHIEALEMDHGRR